MCRFPFCDAPIRHDDHVVAAAHGGGTTASNGQGLCARHNFVKALAGWRSVPRGGGTAPAIVTRTPTGHRHLSPAPPVLDLLPGVRSTTTVRVTWRELLDTG